LHIQAEPSHGIAMYGEPALPADFQHLPYADPDAPPGGRLVLGETGAFDSLNPYILKGNAPWPIQALTVESLMARSYDEPFTLYGLLAESVETPPDRSWVEFTLRPEARFSDGAPVTVEDVIWSFETLGLQGHPRYRNAWGGVRSVRRTGRRSVRIDFAEPNRELPLLLGLRPVLQKAQWQGKDFASAANTAVIGSGPYVLDAYEPGRFIEFRRDPDWWGRDLPINRGFNNFERIRFEYFRNQDALWEAVKAGGISIFADNDPVRWVEGYDFAAATEGTLQRSEIAHQRPTGMEGFVFNTRRAIFADRRVREALALTFDWEWINSRLFRDGYERIASYFDNSPLGFEGPARGRERDILLPFADSLPEDTLRAGWRPPTSDGSGRDRRNLRRAGALLDEAGWPVGAGGVRRDGQGRALAFEILVASTRDETLASLWRDSLARIGVPVAVRLVDEAQYIARRTDYDYDMIVNRWAMSLSPGTEQRLYFGSAGRETPGTRNYMGVADPAVDAAIEAMLATDDPGEFQAAVRALDRVLSSGIYVIPFGVLPDDRIVWRAGLGHPDRTSLYGWWGWWAGPAVWWQQPAD
jgi:peptide/nickel transport system substrate-binding protein